MRHKPIGRAFGFDLIRGLAERQRFGLCKHVRDQHVVMRPQRIERSGERNEIARNKPRTLMYELIERMLSVGAGLAPIDWPGVIVDARAIERDVLAVALHSELLEICGKSFQILLVGEYGDSLGAKEIVVPDANQAHQHRQIALERCSAEMLVDLMEAA